MIKSSQNWYKHDLLNKLNKHDYNNVSIYKESLIKKTISKRSLIFIHVHPEYGMQNVEMELVSISAESVEPLLLL